MKIPFKGAIDCDMHPAVPQHGGAAAVSRRLLARPVRQPPHRPHAVHAHELSAELAALSAGPDWRADVGAAGQRSRRCCARRRSTPSARASRSATCCTARSRCSTRTWRRRSARAVNDWIAKELARPRAAAARLDPGADAEPASSRSTRSSALAADRRFVQVLLLVMGDMPLGQPHLLADLRGGREARPSDRRACRQHLPHRADRRRAGRRYQVEDYVAQSRGLRERSSLSFIAEGVFQKFPELKLVLHRVRLHLAADAALAHQQDLARRARRSSVARPAAGRDHPRARALHAAAARCAAGSRRRSPRTLEHIGSDELLLFSTDYPHWHFDGDDVLPDGLSESTMRQRF